jgi:hypothetical protein
MERYVLIPATGIWLASLVLAAHAGDGIWSLGAVAALGLVVVAEAIDGRRRGPTVARSRSRAVRG